MISLLELREFLGWCTLINSGLLLFSTLALLALKKTILPFHARLFGTEEKEISKLYMHYLSWYKVLVIVFNLSPYLALRMMTS